MAKSGSFNGSVGAAAGINPAVSLRASWKVNSQSGNSSNMTVTVTWSQLSSVPTSGTFEGTLTINGVNYGVSVPISTSGSGTLVSRTVNVAHNADGTKSVAIRLTGSVPGTKGWQSTSLSGTATLDKISSPPAAPTAPTVARNASRGVTLSWTFGSGGSARTGVEVWRKKGTAAYAKVAVLGKDVTSYVDTGIDDLSAYKWKIRVLSASSSKDGPESGGAFYWAAPVPAGLSAVKQADGSITVTTTSTGLLGIEWYRNGVLAATVGVGTAAVASTWVDDSPASGANVYTAKAFAGGTGVYRGYSALSAPSNTVSTLAKPNPPTNLKPDGGLAAVGPVTLSWSHNPTDTTAQTAYELRWRASGGSTWTTLTGTTARSRAVTLSTPGTYEFQVRTKGSFAEWSNWSAVATFTTITRPLVSVSSPSSLWISPILKLTWSWSQAQGRPQSSWKVTLKDSGGVTLETKSGSGAKSEYKFATRLEDGKQYSVLVEAWAGDVSASPDTASFKVVFVPPNPPKLFGSWDDTSGSHTVTIESAEVVVLTLTVVDGAIEVDLPSVK